MTAGYIIITIVAFILILGILVLVHELGHFLTARLFKVRVEEFGIGFPPRVYPSRERVRRRRASGKTVYSLNALPLGGFVRLAGENGVTTSPPANPNSHKIPRADHGGAQWDTPGSGYGVPLSLSGGATPVDDPGAFASKPAWQRAIVLAAGAFNNMALAMLLVFFMLAVIGTPQAQVEISAVARSSPAMSAGLRAGDVIYRIDGKTPQGAADVKSWIQTREGQSVRLEILRSGHIYSTSLVPRYHYRCDEGAMGVLTSPLNPHYAPAPLGQAAGTALNVPVAVVQGIASLPSQMNPPPSAFCTPTTPYLTFGGHWVNASPASIDPYLPNTKSTALDDQCLSASGGGAGIAGPIGIIRQIGCEANSVSTQGWVPLLTLVVDLSASLAVLNLLPVPALDGGRLLFVLISVVARRRVRPEIEGMAHALGMAALLTLMLVISWHDLTNWIGHQPTF